MLATLTDHYFSDPDWIFERKLDGVRCLVFRKGSRVRVMSRNRNDMSKTYPELVEAMERQKAREFIVDGEIAAFEGTATSFARLQQRIGISDPDEARRSGVAVYLYLFDILHIDGTDTTKLPLRARKKILRRALRYRDPLRYTTHRNRDGEKLLAEACKKGWEGLIAKRADSRYVHKRSRDWLKFKCSRGRSS